MSYLCGMKILKPFKFKQFSVQHNVSIHKVGVDGTLLGAWCTVPQSGEILDIGTGSGLIALMCAQRSLDAHISAIEIDTPSCEEASRNFSESPWSARLEAINEDFLKFSSSKKYDLIVSNPPFFDSGVKEITTPRESARHQCALPIDLLIKKAAGWLSASGILALVLPADQEEKIIKTAGYAMLRCARLCRVKGNPGAPEKRILIELMPETSAEKTEITSLILEESPLIPTEAYRTLCHDFYLKF